MGQAIIMEDFKEWQKKKDEERGEEFEEVILYSICLSAKFL